MSEGYHPEVDDSPLCTEDDSVKYRSIIGCCIWMIVLGRFDIAYATSAMSKFNMLPREGYLKAVKSILSYLKTFPKGRVIIDTSYPDHSVYPVEYHSNWMEFYPDASEEIPKDLPPEKGPRVATELILEVRYMLRSLGVALDGPALMLGDNMSVVLSTTVPSSVLKKKHNAIAYHLLREAIVARIMRFAYIKSVENVSDVLTKP
jgi:hypothetical protein